MSIYRLENARDYFENITEPAYRQFTENEITFLVIYSMAAGLFHIAEWVYLHDSAKVQARFGDQVTSAGKLWSEVEAAVANAGFIRDLNNAAKHAKLSFNPQKPTKRDPSTRMHFAANTFIYTVGWGEGGYGDGPYGGSPPEVIMDEGGREILLEPIATDVFKFWEALIDEFYPKTI